MAQAKQGAKTGAKTGAKGPKGQKGVWKLYEVKGSSLVRKNKWSPKQGEGFFMANHKDRQTCGKTGYTEFKKKE